MTGGGGGGGTQASENKTEVTDAVQYEPPRMLCGGHVCGASLSQEKERERERERERRMRLTELGGSYRCCVLCVILVCALRY